MVVVQVLALLMPVLLLRSRRVSQDLDYAGMWPEVYEHICKKYKVPALPLSLNPLGKAERASGRQRAEALACKLKPECQIPVGRRGLVSKAKPPQRPSGRPLQNSELQRPPKRARLSSQDQAPPAPRTIAQGKAGDCLVRCVDHGQWRQLRHCKSVDFVHGRMTHRRYGDKRCKVTHAAVRPY